MHMKQENDLVKDHLDVCTKSFTKYESIILNELNRFYCDYVYFAAFRLMEIPLH